MDTRRKKKDDDAFDRTRYPDRPGFKTRGTSEDSARDMMPRAPTLRMLCLAVLKGERMTADEVAAELGESRLAIRPRLSELYLRSLIQPCGFHRRNRSGKNAIVWEAAK